MFIPAVATLLLVVCGSWGFLIHRTVSQLAVYQLPRQMQPFFYEHLDEVVKYAIRPDERRSSDPKEGPKHFIDFESYGDSAAWKMPENWSAAVQRYSKDSLLKYGYVPYWVMEMKSRLTNAFRKRNADSILFYAADLAHYIADANVPLHTSANHDGQLTNQRGLHSLWESVAPELALEQFHLAGNKKARYLKNPEKEIWRAVRHAHALLPAVFGVEKELTKAFTPSTKYSTTQRNGRDVNFYSTEFAQAYAQRLRQSINDQLLCSANLIASFWYTAWVDGDRPDLVDLLPQTFTYQEKKAMKQAEKAYRKNTLLKNNLLLSRKMAFTDQANN